MRFKLDENLGGRALRAFEDAQHDVSTIVEQDLAGATDHRVWTVCATERRVLVTLDLDFANPLQFDPRSTSGVAVLRLPKLHGATDVDRAVATLLEGLAAHEITGALWIVRVDRIRVWQPVENGLDD